MPKLAKAVLKAFVMWSVIIALLGLGKIVYDFAGDGGLMLMVIGILLFVWSVCAIYEHESK